MRMYTGQQYNNNNFVLPFIEHTLYTDYKPQK